MRKSSARTQNYRSTGSPNAVSLARFRQQMADYARGQRLRELRERKHESQENAAFAVGVSVKTLRAWEHGGKIRWQNAKRLGSFYGVDPEGLVSREEALADTADSEPVTQLDTIERKLDRILGLLTGAGTDLRGEVARAVAETVQEVEKAGSRQPQAPAQPGTRRAVSRRKSA